ncbi:ATP-binding protein [Rubinisphaera margarita]|uniref:ATP-binding protein n=1 Tax=Rubinisphaera margarita TaxID=2909586 RepID=UPI001EE861D6|nr:ATP-binding protein [Rubinisphaera margarita]MCG6157129.1 putative DNA binding domain-containing protein [Rubinisphaera margarita]
MTAEEIIEQLNAVGEHVTLEAKTASKAIGDALPETICAFANTQGGILILGVAKEKNSLFYKAVGVDDADAIQQQIASCCKTTFDSAITVQMRPEIVQGKCVVVVEVRQRPPQPRHLFIKRRGYPDGVYIRVGAADEKGFGVDQLEDQKEPVIETQFDYQILPDASMSELETSAIRRYTSAKMERDPFSDVAGMPDLELIKGLGAAREAGGKTVPTRFGILAFGGTNSLREHFPFARVDIVRVPGCQWIPDPGQEDFHETFEFRETLQKLVHDVANTLISYMPRFPVTSHNGLIRQDVPKVQGRIIREVIVNAIMHRSYREQSQIRIVCYDNRIEVQNPGTSLVEIDQLGNNVSRNRNPRIASYLHDLGLAENKASGIGTLRRKMNQFGFPPPVFLNDAINSKFTATLILRSLHSKENDAWIDQFSPLELSDKDRDLLVIIRELNGIASMSVRSIYLCTEKESLERLGRLESKGLLVRHQRSTGKYFSPSDAMLYPCSHGWSRDSCLGTSITPSPDANTTPIDVLDLPDPPPYIQRQIDLLRDRSSRVHLTWIILSLCDWRALQPFAISAYVKRDQEFLRTVIIADLLRDDLLAINGNRLSPTLAYYTTQAGQRWLVSNVPDTTDSGA